MAIVGGAEVSESEPATVAEFADRLGVCVKWCVGSGSTLSSSLTTTTPTEEAGNVRFLTNAAAVWPFGTKPTPVGFNSVRGFKRSRIARDEGCDQTTSWRTSA